MIDFDLFIAGHPEPQGRPRIRKTGKFARMYSPITPWRKFICTVLALKVVFRQTGPIDVPCAVNLTFLIDRPKSQTRKQRAVDWCVGKSDLDNYAKAVFDALVDAEVIANDNLIVQSFCEKVYAGPNFGSESVPGVRIVIKDPVRS